MLGFNSKKAKPLKKIAECAKDAIIMMGPKGEIFFWNPAAERIFGYSRNEAIGKHLHKLPAPERFRDAYQKGLSCFQKTGQGNALGKTLKLEAIRKNGEEFSIELSVNSVHLGGKWHAVGIIRDMSESKEAEADWANKDKATVVTGKSTT
jgi:PAS domain S-box-containing protein